MTHLELVSKILQVCPGAHFTLHGNTYDGLIWLDAPETKPTAQELGI